MADWKDITKTIGGGLESWGKSLGKGISNAGSGNYNPGLSVSDERMKEILGEGAPLDAFGKINAYVYEYNDKAKNLYEGEKGVDDKEHLGVLAQELAENPVTAAAVHTDENGYLEVDTAQLTLTNTAMISQVIRRLQKLEKMINGGNK